MTVDTLFPDLDAPECKSAAQTATRPTTPAVTVLDVFVPGRPAPQGSKRYLGPGRPLVESSKAVEPWRADIREHLLARHAGGPLLGAVTVTLEFVLPRPASLPKRKPTPRHTKRPDVDKLARAVLDAVTSAGVWCDDSQVDDMHPTKRYAELGEAAGCHIRIQEEGP